MAFLPQNSGQSRQSYMYSPQYQMGLANIQQGADTSPVLSPWQGLARVLQAGIGGYQTQKAESDFEASEADRRKRLSELLAGRDTLAGGSMDPNTLAQLAEIDPQLGDYIMYGQIENMMNPESDPLVEVWDGTKMIRVPQSQAVGMQSQPPDDPEAPVVKDFFEGGQVIQKQWDPATETWVPIGSGPRWAPPQAPSPTDFDKQWGLIEQMPEGPEKELAKANFLGYAPPDPGDDPSFGNENTLRDDWNRDTKPLRDVSEAIFKVRTAAANPSPAGDISLIFGYMKMIDQGSTVREGEKATVENARGVPETIRALYNRVMTGEGLTPDQRLDIAAQAENLLPLYQNQYQSYVDQYTANAKHYGLDPAFIISPIEWGTTPGATPAPTEPIPQPTPGGGTLAPPTVGQVIDGYRFKGGDPADPNSWERAQ